MAHAEAENVIIALGNRFRGDDGVGPHVAGKLKARGLRFAITEGPMDTLRILSIWEGAPLAVVIDAACSGAPPGTVRRIELGAGALPKELGRCSSHGLGIAEAVALGQVLGRMPARLVIYTVEAKSFAFGAPLSSEVESALGNTVRRVEKELAACVRAERNCDARSLARP